MISKLNLILAPSECLNLKNFYKYLNFTKKYTFKLFIKNKCFISTYFDKILFIITF